MVGLLNKRFAVIDIGSNGVRLQLASACRINNKLDIRKESLVRIPIRLGEDVFDANGALSISKIKSEELINTIKGFSYLIKAYKPAAVRAVATSAMREAKNSKEIIRKIYKDSKLKIETITGLEEAQMIYSAHMLQSFAYRGYYMYIDVGGGSTEIIIFNQNKIIDFKSFNVGTVRYLQKGENEEEKKTMKQWLNETFPATGRIITVGTGGNINRTLKILGQKKQTELSYAAIKQFHDSMKNLTTEDRIRIYNLKKDRADVIVPALKIFLFILKNTGQQSISIPNIGLVDGLICQLATDNKI